MLFTFTISDVKWQSGLGGVFEVHSLRRWYFLKLNTYILMDTSNAHMITIIIHLIILTWGTAEYSCKSNFSVHRISTFGCTSSYALRRGWRPRSSWKLYSGQTDTSYQQARRGNAGKYKMRFHRQNVFVFSTTNLRLFPYFLFNPPKLSGNRTKKI